MARLRANLAAIQVLRTVHAEARAATSDEQAVLARWSGWGAVPGVFEARTNHPNYARFAAERGQLRELLSPGEYAAAERTTLNAHYTDARYVQAIWDAVVELGFDGGAVLEPGCGSGTFIGLAPAGASMVGVELDPVTAGIAAALYPHADVRVESFADTRAPTGAFDATVGNVPFADVALVDRRHNPGRHSIHNHFIIKSLHLTRPGGLVAVLTSRYTMDAANPAARREMAELADLVAAVRLPAGAHQAAAGTQVVTDLLILRRREPDRPTATTAWEQTRPLDVATDAEQPDQVNEYFLAHPERVLGEMTLGRGMHRDGELVVRATGDVDQQLTAALSDVVAGARVQQQTMTPRGDGDRPGPPGAVLAPTGRAEGHIETLDDGTFTTVVNGQVVEHPAPQTQAAELRALLVLRDTVTALLDAEAATLDDGDEPGGQPAEGTPAALRARLNTQYDAYVGAYGPLNRFTLRPTGHVDQDTGEPKMARINPPMGKFRQTDPHAATVFALEFFDDATQTATKADIFRRRVILPREPRLGADTPEDALAICLDTQGVVSLAEVARLLGASEAEARAQLGELVYDEPGTGQLVETAEYLSGQVRAKLREAQAAATDDPRFEANVRALQKVIPRDRGPGEIYVAFGAPFIAASYVEAFLHETLRDAGLRVEHVGGSDWRVRGNRSGVLARSTWGTSGMSAPELAQRLLTKTPIRVFYEIEEGKRALDAEATAAAQAKAGELEERFAAWVWEDPHRAAELAGVYNEMFNATVPRSYVGVQRSLPGLADTFKPRPHQVEAVARIVNEPAVGLFHAVGAGKTAVMAMSAMEQRRLGLVTKPAIIVPNHMLEQFTREFLQIYPRAKLLAAGREDASAERRRRFVARCATGDWDAIIMAASFFERLALSPEGQRQFLDDELAELREKVVKASEQAIASGEDPHRSSSVKRLQRALLKKEEKIKEKLDKAKDPGVTFEQTGIDYLYRDELHELKNDTVVSSITDAANDGSDRAIDFRMKLGYLRRQRGMRVVCGATATPISNSVRELYVVTRQLRPDLLEATGTVDFDTWASAFARVVTAVEISPTGTEFQMRSRLSKYTNMRQLSLMLRTFGDVRTPEDLNLPTPALTVREDGERAPRIVPIDPSQQLLEYISDLDERVERIRNRQVDQKVDNMAKVSTQARAASLDLRLLVDGLADASVGGKLDAVAEHIATIWRETRDNVYLGADGQEDPVRGGLQIVFCDQGTPKPDRWNVYHALADQLADQGLPREAIRFIHEADTDAKKAALFQACRTGEVAVLIGSTAKMGVGTNVQARAVALHHVDCPWRPADITQREGRILRQGNQNPEVSIYRYVVTSSFDAFSWQTVARKGTSIDQIMRGTVDDEIDDVSDETLQAHQVKAIATGNPLIIDREELAQDLARLERAEHSHYNTHAALRHQITDLEGWIGKDTGRMAAFDAAIAQRITTRGDQFVMTVAGHRLTKRPEAGRALQHALRASAQGVHGIDQREVEGLAQLGGFNVDATFWTGRDGLLVSLKLVGVPDSATVVSVTSAVDGDPTGLVRRLEHQLADLETNRAAVEWRIEAQREEITRAGAQLDQPFARHGDLQDVRRRLRSVNAVIGLLAEPIVAPGVSPPAVEVTVADWLPAELRADLPPDQQTWLERRVQRVAGNATVQAAARSEDTAAYTAAFDKALTAALADPSDTQMAIAVFLRCDDQVWRQRLYSAAGEAVTTAVRTVAPPSPSTASSAATPSTTAETDTVAPTVEAAPARRGMSPAELAAATTPEQRTAMNTWSKQAMLSAAVREAAANGDLAAFATAFTQAFDAAVADADPSVGGVLAPLQPDPAFRAGLTYLVWTKWVLASRAVSAPGETALTGPAAAAAVVAQAFPAHADPGWTGPSSAEATPTAVAAAVHNGVDAEHHPAR